ncbi:MAG: hypothetical protein KGL53_08720 [Elusimicrobia bacterium]|nr:hypothetical protein [Elusimicrobiota bacterium]
MKKPLRSAAKSARKSRAPSRSAKSAAAPEMTPDEVARLEQISRRYEDAERAWQRMTAPPDGDETWNLVEEHLLARAPDDQDRRWKYFSK